MLLIIIPIVIILVISGLSILLIRWRDNKKITEGFFRQAMSQMISVVLSSIIGFGSAFALWKYQENFNDNNSKVDAIGKIFNEISANRLDLELESARGKRLMRAFLKTEEWENGKHYLSFKTPDLRGGLKILYYETEDYNNLVSFINHKVMENNLTIEKMPEEAWESLDRSDKDLISKFKEFEKLVSRELVLQKHKSKKEYEKEYGKWQNKVEVPYFSKKPEENNSP